MSVLSTTERRRRAAAGGLDAERQVLLGQFFTPEPVARFMAAQFEFRSGPARLLDPGAGVDQLAAAFVERWQTEQPTETLSVASVECDSTLHGPLHSTLDTFGLDARLVGDDYIWWASRGDEEFDYVVANPPYGKLHAQSDVRRAVQCAGVDVPNQYAAFIAMAIRQLAPGGQLVAITPRSFANGPYFRAFRQDLLRRTALRAVHVYDSRRDAFRDSAVLQENVVFRVERADDRTSVFISSSASSTSGGVTALTAPYFEVVQPSDPESFIRTPSKAGQHVAQGETLKTLGLVVSTGRVVDFRSPAALRAEWSDGDAPLLYPTHLREASVTWPQSGKKPNALRVDAATRRFLLPAGNYVLIKRFSAKEERRRVVAALLTPDDLPGVAFAVENHLSVIHAASAGLDAELALGLVAWLNSTLVDQRFREFSGHTQVHATDLRTMAYPAGAALRKIAADLGGVTADQQRIDVAVAQHA